METTVRLFATLREAAGTETATVQHAEGATVREVLDALADSHPALRDRLYTDENGDGADGPTLAPHLNLTADGEPVSPDATVEPDTELAVFPPVSGG